MGVICCIPMLHQNGGQNMNPRAYRTMVWFGLYQWRQGVRGGKHIIWILQAQHLATVKIITCFKLKINVKYFPMDHPPWATIDVAKGGHAVADVAWVPLAFIGQWIWKWNRWQLFLKLKQLSSQKLHCVQISALFHRSGGQKLEMLHHSWERFSQYMTSALGWCLDAH